MECMVCISAYNKSTRKQTPCGYCDFEVCQTCVRTYLLQSSQDPHCMSCRHAWNREFLDSRFPAAFIDGQLKEHRCKVLLEREKSLMPETLPLLEFEKEVSNMEAEKSKLREKLEETKKKYNTVYPFGQNHCQEAMFQYFDNSAQYNIKTYKIKENIKTITYKINFMRMIDITKEARQKRFVRSCPAEGCRGFLSTQWKCGLCDVWVCPDCHEIKGMNKNTEHTCKPENVETAKLLAKDTKPCPKCATPIFKISGCDQIWCTQCHVAFSWKTGLIEKGPIHNPHYYEYMKNTTGSVPRQPGDVPCGGMPDLWQINAIKSRFIGKMPITTIRTIHRLYRHIIEVIRPRYQVDYLADNRDLRIKYLLNEIDEEYLKKLLQIREKRNTKKTEIFQVIEMFSQVLIDIFQRILDYNEKDTKNENVDFGKEFENIRIYYNEAITKINKRYKSSINIYISKEWTM